MDQTTQTFGGMDASLVLWIAAGVAGIFMIIVLVDFIGQRRKYRRLPLSRAAAQPSVWKQLLNSWPGAKDPTRRRRK
jgi:hypothetical protein